MKLRHFLIILCFAPLLTIGQMNMQPKGSLSVVMEPEIEQLLRVYHNKNQGNKKLTGYRVQIYNGKKAKMMEVRSEFVDMFPDVPVYNIYDSPEYKLQVGDFRTRLEAERFLRQVIAEFGSGFVVRTMIRFPQLYYPVKE